MVCKQSLLLNFFSITLCSLHFKLLYRDKELNVIATYAFSGVGGVRVKPILKYLLPEIVLKSRPNLYKKLHVYCTYSSKPLRSLFLHSVLLKKHCCFLNKLINVDYIDIKTSSKLLIIGLHNCLFYVKRTCLMNMFFKIVLLAG